MRISPHSQPDSDLINVALPAELLEELRRLGLLRQEDGLQPVWAVYNVIFGSKEEGVTERWEECKLDCTT